MENKKSFPPTTIPATISIVMLFAGIPKFFPYGYYTLLRLVVCGTGVYIALLSFDEDKQIIGYISAFIAILFNPLIPVHLPKDVWVLIDLIVAIFFGISIFALRTKE